MFEEFQEPINVILKDNNLRSGINLLSPPNPDLGDFCIVVNQVAGKDDPEQVAKKLIHAMEGIDGIKEVSLFNTGNKKKKIIYLNYTLEQTKRRFLLAQSIDAALSNVKNESYGYFDTNNGKKIMVEHTSANPISPLHVGNLRNSVQGDTFARILKHSGYEVFVHYYVNDVGLQIAFVTIGYEIIKNKGIKPPIKIDLWTGQIYAIMNCFFNIQKLKQAGSERKLELTSNYSISENDEKLMIGAIENELNPFVLEISKIEKLEKPSGDQKKKLKEIKISKNKLDQEIGDIRKYLITTQDLKTRFPHLFHTLEGAVNEIDLLAKVAEYLRAYETNSDPRITELFREVVLWVLSAFEWTLHRYNIDFDKFDFESDVTWSGRPDEIIEALAKTENAKVEGQAVRYQYPSHAMKSFMKVAKLTKQDLTIRGQVPDLQLRRSDGTALYAAKDIAYSLSKFEDRSPERIYNVISMEQSLPQFQLLLPLHELGYTEYAANLKHYAYDNVDLRGRTMSGRLAKYITADEYYDESYIRARMAKRTADTERGLDLPNSPHEWEQENEILTAVTLASTRFPLIETNPKKRIELDLDRELDFKRNSGPFVQYAHARTHSLLNKAAKEKGWHPGKDKIDSSLIAENDIAEICVHLDQLKTQILLSIRDEDPSKIASWVLGLAQQFMKFYEKFPVMKAEENTAMARLELVDAIRKGLKIGLEILGIPAANRL